MDRVFDTGIPTSPDVQKLMDKFKPRPGDELTHADIAACIATPFGTSRYHTVTSAWRRRLEREQNLLLAAIPGAGFRVLPPDERISHCVNKVNAGRRVFRKAGVRASMTPPDQLSTADRAKRQHMIALAAQVDAVTTDTMRQLAPPSSAKTTLRPLPPPTNKG